MEFLYCLIHYILSFTGVAIFLKKRGLDLKSSLGHSGWLTLCIIYIFYKSFFLTGLSTYTIYGDILIDFFVLAFLCKNFKFSFITTQLLRFKKIGFGLFLIIGIPLVYGLILASILSPTTIDVNSYHESRILLLQQQNSFFLSSFNDICEVVYGFGYDLVLHNHLRFGIDRGLGIYGYISFLCILCFLYNFYNDKKLDKFSTLLPCFLFLGLIEPIYQSFSAKNDLPGVLACLASYHAYISWQKEKLDIHVILSFLALTWAVACKKTYLAFALPMILFWGLQWLKNKQYFKLSVQQIFGFALVLLFVSPLLTYIYNITLWGNWSGPTHFVEHHTNNSVILGTLANFFRYFFEIFHFPFFVEKFSSSLLGISPVNIINNGWINYFHPIFGSNGESTWSFQVNWEQLEDSWFGPIGFLLFLYFIYKVFQKILFEEREAKIILLTYLLAICLMLAWRPFNDRYFTLFFTFIIILFAANIGKSTFSRFGKIITTSVSLFLFYWALMLNNNLPTFNFLSLNLNEMLKDASTNGILVRTDFGERKLGYAQIPEKILLQLSPNSKIAVWIDNYCPHASVTRQLHSFKLKPLNYTISGKFIVDHQKELNFKQLFDFDYLLHSGGRADLSGFSKHLKIWEHQNAENISWTLYKLIHA